MKPIQLEMQRTWLAAAPAPLLAGVLVLATPLALDGLASRYGSGAVPQAAWCAVVFIAVQVALAGLGSLRSERRASEASADEMARRAERDGVLARLARGLEMTTQEAEAIDLVARSLAPFGRVEILLGEDGEAPLRNGRDADAAVSCGVARGLSCAAFCHGRTMGRGGCLDACPRAAAGTTCVPIAHGGRMVGVVSVRDATLGPADIHVVEAAATCLGARLGAQRLVARTQAAASTDPLTGLLNRRGLEAAWSRIARDGVPHVLAMADLDHFKRLNDTHGHETGDRALRVFAQTLRGMLRPDDIVARYGGEEFVVVLPRCTSAHAPVALERVRTALAAAVARTRLPAFTASFGVADAVSGEGLDGLVMVADAALYEAKRGGRDRIVVAGDAAPASCLTLVSAH